MMSASPPASCAAGAPSSSSGSSCSSCRHHRQLGVLGALDRASAPDRAPSRAGSPSELDDLAETGGEIAIIADGIDVDDPGVARRSPPGSPHRRLDGVIDVADPWSTGVDGAAGQRRARRARRRHPRRRPRRGGRARPRPRDRRRRPRPRRPRGARRRQRARRRDSSPPHRRTISCGARPSRCRSPSSPWSSCSAACAAAGMPLLVALGGVVTTLAVLVGATVFGDVSIFSVNVVNMLGIGLGIDYGLLMVNRFREERGHGRERPRRRRRRRSPPPARRSSSRRSPSRSPCPACSCSALPILTSFGIAGLGVVLLCMAAAVTLLPATLAAVGGKIPPTAPVPTSTAASTGSPAGCRPRRRRRRRGAVVLVLLGAAVPRRPLRERRRPHPAPVVGGARRRAHPRRPLPGPRHRSRHRRSPTPTPTRRRSPRGSTSVSTTPGVVGVAIRPGHPGRSHRRRPHAGGHLAGRAGHRALVEQLRGHAAELRHRGRRPRRRAHRHQGQAQRTAAARRAHGRHAPRSCCCS